MQISKFPGLKDVLSLSISIILVLVFLQIYVPAIYAIGTETFDGRIGVVIDQVERQPSPLGGYDDYTIYLTVTRIEGGHMFELVKNMMDRTVLLDANGQEISCHDQKAEFQGINFRDPHDIRSEKEFIEGTTGILTFQIPSQSDPFTLQFAYFFGESWDDYDSPTCYQIDINLIYGAPIPDIKVNGLDSPVTLDQSDTPTVTVALNNNGITENADWWLAADTPFGLYFFTFEGWTTDWIPAYQGPLFPLDSYEVLNMPVSGLPPGTYTLYFGVDTYMDRNVTWDSVYYDTVVVNITEANGYASPTILWEKTFGGTDHDSGYSVQQTSDGGYIIVGETSSYGAGDFDVYLIKTDSEGNRMWEKTFGGTKGDHGYSVQQTSDGGYIIVGETSSYGVGYTNVYLIKTNPEGNLVWQKTFGSFDGTGYNSGYSVEQISDGSYVIVGSNGSDVYLIKVDSQGNLVWEKTFGGTKGDHGRSVQQTSDGGYIIVGETSSYGASVDVYLIKTDSEGNRVWEKTFGGTSWDDGECVQQTSDGGYIIVGQTGWTTPNSDVYLIKVDSQGNLVWEKTFGGTDHDSGYSVQQTSDGGYIVVGATGSVGLSWRDIYLLKVDSQGNLAWEKTFGGTKSTWGPSIERTSDGAYVIVGGIEYDEANKEDVLLAKIREQ